MLALFFPTILADQNLGSRENLHFFLIILFIIGLVTATLWLALLISWIMTYIKKNPQDHKFKISLVIAAILVLFSLILSVFA